MDGLIYIPILASAVLQSDCSSCQIEYEIMWKRHDNQQDLLEAQSPQMLSDKSDDISFSTVLDFR